MTIKYWCRIVTLDKNNPLSLIYKQLLGAHIRGYKTWCKTVMNILESLGYHEIWNRHFLDVYKSDIDTVLYNLKFKLQQQYKEEWLVKINDHVVHPILRTYAIFKDTHVFEFYLNRNLAKKYKNSISRFRVSSHNLAIETGRHQKPKIPKENRICVFCTSRHIDNEIHLLIDCEFHINERNILFC